MPMLLFHPAPGSGSSGGLTPGPTSTLGSVDALIDMHTGTVGATLSSTIMGNGTRGNANLTGWSSSPVPPVGMTIGATQANRALGGTVIVDEVAYGPTNPSQAWGLDNTQSFTWVYTAIPSSHRVLTVAGWITLGPAKVVAGSAHPYDLVSLKGAITGGYAILQLNNGAGPGNTYAVALETDPGAVTTHSSWITVVAGNTYWFVIQANYTTGLASLAMYNPSFVQVGTTVTASQRTGEDAQIIRFGNAEVGTSVGTTWFENVVIAYTNPVFPLGPTAT